MTDYLVVLSVKGRNNMIVHQVTAPNQDSAIDKVLDHLAFNKNVIRDALVIKARDKNDIHAQFSST